MLLVRYIYVHYEGERIPGCPELTVTYLSVAGIPLWLATSPLYIWMLIFFTRPHKVRNAVIFCHHLSFHQM